MKELEILKEFGIPFLMRVVAIAVALGLGVWILHVIRRSFALFFAERPYSPETIRASYLALQWIVWIAIVLVMLRIAGVQAGPFAGLGMLVLIALAAAAGVGWTVLTGFACGAVMAKTQPFQIGDDIEVMEPSGVAGPFGRVIAFNYLYTTLQQTDAESGRTSTVQVPNACFYRKAIRREPGEQTSPLQAPPRARSS